MAMLLCKPGCTVLVFLPGLAEITSLCAAAQEHDRSSIVGAVLDVIVFGMHSEIPAEDMQGAFIPPDDRSAHIVFASTIAESSLTLPNVAATIDVGLHRRMEYDWNRKSAVLSVAWTSKASATQRSGRAGRTMNGIGVRLYTRSFHERLADFDRPEILEAPMPKIYLQAKELSHQLETLPRSATEVLALLPQPPELRAVQETLRSLASLGAIERASDDAELSPLGRVCLALPVDLTMCKLVWLGCLWGCAADAVILACCADVVKDPFTTPMAVGESIDSVQLAKQLGRSLKSRNHFDKGTFAEPLMLRALFLSWLSVRPAEQLAGYKSWARHARAFARNHAIVPGKLTELVANIANCARKCLNICQPGSVANKQLDSLVRSLGASRQSSNQRAADDGDWADEWEAALQEEEAAAGGPEEPRGGSGVAPSPRRLEFDHGDAPAIEDNAAKLRGLLASAWSDTLVVGRLSEKCEQGLRAIRMEGLDPRRAVVMTSVPAEIRGNMDEIRRVVEVAAGGAPLECRSRGKGKAVMVALPLEGGTEEDAGNPILNHLQGTLLHQVRQFPCKRKGFSIANAEASAAEDADKAAAEQVPVFKRDWVTHPGMVEWKGFWRPSESTEPRVAKIFPSWRDPVGFACHALAREDKAQDFAVLGCCGRIQLVSEGRVGFAKGFAMLRVAELPFWLLTTSLADADVHFGFHFDGAEGPEICAVKLFGQELPCALSPVAFAHLSEARAVMQQLARATPPGSSPRPLGEPHAVCRAIDGLVEIIQDGRVVPDRGCPARTPIGVAWVPARASDADDDVLREFSELQTAANDAHGCAVSDLLSLRVDIARAIHRTNDAAVLNRIKGLLDELVS